MKHLLTLFLTFAWALPASAAITLIGNARAPVQGKIPCVVAFDGGAHFWLAQTVPSGTVDIQAWLTANVSADAEAAWKARTLEPGYVPAVVPEEWTHEVFTWNSLSPKMQAILGVLFDEINALRANASLSERTPQQAISAVKAKLNE